MPTKREAELEGALKRVLDQLYEPVYQVRLYTYPVSPEEVEKVLKVQIDAIESALKKQ